MDANQVWGVDQAIAAPGVLGEFDPWWSEKPTSPDDVLGHRRIKDAVAPKVATGEHVQNRVVSKQLFQAGAIDVCQIDACRVAGVNEVLAIILRARTLAGADRPGHSIEMLPSSLAEYAVPKEPMWAAEEALAG